MPENSFLQFIRSLPPRLDVTIKYIHARPRLSAFLLALMVVAAVFPDIIFRGASFLITDQWEASNHGLPPRSFFPWKGHRQWWGFYSDDGGALWQSEPMLQFMRYCLYSLNSPFWNPYSAAGALGPETLVDLKFSIITIASVLLGGSSQAYNFVLISCYVMAGYCILRIFRDKLALSTTASVAVAGFYMLNGYATANSASNVFLSYLFIPICILASLNYVTQPSLMHFGRLALSFALLLSFSFFPTTIMSIITISGCIAGFLYTSREKRTSRELVIISAGYVLAGICACAVLAVFFLPFIESTTQSGILDSYQMREFTHVSLGGIFSLFTPSHFFESYNAMEEGAHAVLYNTAYHFGVIGLLVAACGIGFSYKQRVGIIFCCLAIMLVGFGRIFYMKGVYQIIDHLPLLRNIGCQYWWVTIAIPLMFLVGFGVDNIQKNRPAKWPMLVVLEIGIVSAIYIGYLYGLHAPHVPFKIISLVLSAVLAGIVTAVVWIKRPFTIDRPPIKRSTTIVILLFFELILNGKQLREPAVNFYTSPPPWVQYVKSNIGPYRTLSIGWAGLMGERGSSFQIPEASSMNDGVFPGYEKFFYKTVILDLSQYKTSNPTRYKSEFPSLINMKDTPEKNKFDWFRLDLLGVKYILLPPDFKAYEQALQADGLHPAFKDSDVIILENPNVLPRAFVLNKDIDPALTDAALPDGFQRHIKAADIVTYRNAEVRITGNAAKPDMLVLTDNWHLNWRATVNGAPAPIVKVEGTFRGVHVPAGPFTVVMKYAPKSLHAALIISLLSLVLLLSLSCGIGKKDLAQPKAQKFP